MNEVYDVKNERTESNEGEETNIQIIEESVE
jgi:hypothetical protein